MDPASAPASTPQKEIADPSYVNAMSHFYRGELGRIMVWRQRLDVTTTWALTSTTTIITVAFSFRDIPHIIFFFNLVIVFMLLWIEARRYRFYDAFRGRVRMIESHFLVAMISQNTIPLEGEWKRLVCEDLVLPSFKISRIEAIGRRMKRNYAFIIGFIIFAWMTKIFMHAQPPINSWTAFYSALTVGELPGWFVGGILVFTIISSVGLTWYVSVNSAGEVTDLRSSHREQWRI